MENKNKAAIALAKLRHQKSPAPKEFYLELSRKGVEARKAKKLLLDKQPSA